MTTPQWVPEQPSATAPSPPTRRNRVRAAIAIGLAFGLFSMLSIGRPNFTADFLFSWRATRLLLDGVNPYGFVLYHGEAIYGGVALIYPLPALWVLAPLARIDVAVAGGLFTALSFGALSYRLTHEGWWRLWAVGSGPAIFAAMLGQWSPLLLLSALVPALAPLAVVKPSVGLALFAARPSRWAVLAGGAILIASIVALPSWPALWLRGALASDQHISMLSVPLGWLLLLGALRWRTPGGRLLLVLGCVRQFPYFYDQLLLFMIPRDRDEAIGLSAFSSVGVLAWYVTAIVTQEPYQLLAAPFVMGFCYVPALVLVLRHPNVGDVPPWANHVAAVVHRAVHRMLPTRRRTIQDEGHGSKSI